MDFHISKTHEEHRGFSHQQGPNEFVSLDVHKTEIDSLLHIRFASVFQV